MSKPQNPNPSQMRKASLSQGCSRFLECILSEKQSSPNFPRGRWEEPVPLQDPAVMKNLASFVSLLLCGPLVGMWRTG